MGVGDQCSSLSTSPPGLVYCWGRLNARPDQRVGILDGVLVFILRRAVVEVERGGHL